MLELFLRFLVIQDEGLLEGQEWFSGVGHVQGIGSGLDITNKMKYILVVVYYVF